MCCRVGKCCFCINLRAGVITIACVLMVADSLILGWTSYGTHRLNVATQDLQARGNWNDPTEIIVLGTFWLALMIVAMYSLAVPLDIMLLVGAIRVRRRLLHGWIVAYAVVYGIFLVINLPSLVLSFMASIYNGLISSAVILIHAGLTVYFWIMVRSYYLQVIEQHGEGGPHSMAGKDCHMVPTGHLVPAQGPYYSGGGMAMQPTAPPTYTRTA